MRMKVFILLWIGLFSICYANAQQVITGQVADQSGRPIPFANVLILAATDSALVTGGVKRRVPVGGGPIGGIAEGLIYRLRG